MGAFFPRGAFDFRTCLHETNPLSPLSRETRLQQRYLRPQIFCFFCFLNLGEISEGRLGLLVRGERVEGV